MRPEFTERFGGPFRNFEQRTSECASVAEALEQNYVVDRKRKKRVRFGRKESDAIFDGGIYDRIAEELERRFEALCQAVKRVPIQALVVDAPNFKDDTEIPRLGEEGMGIDKPVKIHLFVERTRLRVILEDSLKPKHWRSYE